MPRETPMFASSAYSSSSHSASNLGLMAGQISNNYGNFGTLEDQAAAAWDSTQVAKNALSTAQTMMLLRQAKKNEAEPQPNEEPMTTSARRVVKVIVADPNEHMPLDKCVLFTGEEKLTDLTDQELFFEISIAELLTKHNAERVKTIDKTQSAKFGRDIFLEPAKIRDLKMVVVTVATL